MINSKAKKIVKRMINGWTKWGGGNRDIIKDDNPVWYCQTCKVEQMHEYPSFVMEFDDAPVVRICTKCKHIKNKLNIVSYFDLMEKTKSPVIEK